MVKSRLIMRQFIGVTIGIAILIALVLGYFFLPSLVTSAAKLNRLRAWFADPKSHPELSITAGAQCNNAPFILPTTGYVGFGYGDSFRPTHRHQGLDIFGPDALNQTPVIAAHDGYLTRQESWLSTLIIRIPRDPLQPSRQIWAYYTHMADQNGNSFISPQFPKGVTEKFVKAGTLLGYQGNFSGDPDSPVGMHLHFSIVQSNDDGTYKNELKIENTYDPIPYLGLVEQDGVWRCK
jgi:murein DD-endopeptidase MepM/ murein hydrolase activator NlpD